MDTFLYLVVLGITKGSMWALLAVSFSIFYFTTRTFHLAHGAVFTITAYSFYVFISVMKLPLVIAFLLAFPVAILFGILTELFVYQKLRQRYASPTILLLASLAILITTPAILAMFFSTDPRFYPSFPIGVVSAGHIAISGAHLGMLSSWVFIGLMIFVLRATRFGKLMRAVADRELIAQTIGIEVSKVRIIAMTSGSILVVPAAVFYGYDLGVVPSMGFNAILLAAACAIMGGVGSYFGAALSGMIIGLSMNAGVAFISSMWRDGIAFSILVLILLFRPEGIFAAKR